MDCVEVCPVDCFYEGENFLVIHPDECIDCGVCEPECPVEAISDDTCDDAQKWLDINREYAKRVCLSTSQIAQSIRTSLFGKDVSTYNFNDEDVAGYH